VSGDVSRSSLFELAGAVGNALVERGWTVGVAESCTGGWIAEVITEVEGASRYLLGGVVAYADTAKATLLGVSPELLASHGAVSEDVARAMAEGVKRTLGADVGLAVTGIAGPGGDRPGKAVGTVWFGLALPDATVSETALFPGDRAAVRWAATRHAMRMLLNGVKAGGTRDGVE
jgi:PncC family amidohydrolase